MASSQLLSFSTMPALRIVLVVVLVAVSLTEVAENFLDLFLTILLLQLEAGSKFETSKYFRLKLKSFILPNTRGEREWGHNFEPLILDIIGTDRALIQKQSVHFFINIFVKTDNLHICLVLHTKLSIPVKF